MDPVRSAWESVSSLFWLTTQWLAFGLLIMMLVAMAIGVWKKAEKETKCESDCNPYRSRIIENECMCRTHLEWTTPERLER